MLDRHLSEVVPVHAIQWGWTQFNVHDALILILYGSGSHGIRVPFINMQTRPREIQFDDFIDRITSFE